MQKRSCLNASIRYYSIRLVTSYYYYYHTDVSKCRADALKAEMIKLGVIQDNPNKRDRRVTLLLVNNKRRNEEIIKEYFSIDKIKEILIPKKYESINESIMLTQTQPVNVIDDNYKIGRVQSLVESIQIASSSPSPNSGPSNTNAVSNNDVENISIGSIQSIDLFNDFTQATVLVPDSSQQQQQQQRSMPISDAAFMMDNNNNQAPFIPSSQAEYFGVEDNYQAATKRRKISIAAHKLRV